MTRDFQNDTDISLNQIKNKCQHVVDMGSKLADVIFYAEDTFAENFAVICIMTTVLLYRYIFTSWDTERLYCL
jgi:hypothetical protein